MMKWQKEKKKHFTMGKHLHIKRLQISQLSQKSYSEIKIRNILIATHAWLQVLAI